MRWLGKIVGWVAGYVAWLAIVMAVSHYLFHFSDWVTFRLIPVVITVGFLFSVANDVRKMRAAH